MRLALLLAAAALAALAAMAAIAAVRWRRGTEALRERLRGSRLPGSAAVYSSRELEGLPAPVVRFFRHVLEEGTPIPVGARFEQHGTFLLKDAPDGWRPFTAVQDYAFCPPGFVWSARIRVAPGLYALVRDGFVAGRGSMVASLAGAVKLVDVQGTPEIAAAALQRYLAEAAWFPMALLPSQGVAWSPIDDDRALATVASGPARVSLEFRFDPEGNVASVFAPDRFRDVSGKSVPTPWRGRFSRTERYEGVRIPVEGEVEWVLPDGPKPYWRGTLTRVDYVEEGAPWPTSR